MKKYCASFILLFLYAINAYGQCAPDVTPPTITCPGNIISACPQEVPSLTPLTSDFCGAVILQTYVLTGATSIASALTGINDASSEIFLAGVTTVTYYIEDASGNSATCNFTVTVNDYTSPIVVCQDDIITTNDLGLCTAYVDMFALDVFPTAFDSCSGLSTVPTGVPSGSNFPVGTTTVTWIVTDAAGNFVTCLQDVTVTDEEDPTIICPTNITVNTIPGQCDAIVTIPPVLPSDNCTISSITNDYNSGGANASDTFPLGTTTVTYTATDSANRTITCSFDVTVVNTQIPIISLIEANTITLEACGTYTELGATANDNCLGDISSSIIIDASALDTDTVGSYDVTYNVMNVNGISAAQIIRTVIIVDTTPPILSLIGPDPLTIADCSTYTELGALAIDPCFGDISGSIVIDNSTIDTSTLGSYTVTYNVIDASGNVAAQITRIVTVADVTIPLITLIGSDPQTIEACSAYSELGATVDDFCFGDISGSIVIDASAVNTSVVGSYSVTYNVTDVNGNSAFEVIRTVTIVDTTIPIITLVGANPQTIEACSPYIELGATANDPCFGDISGSIVIDTSAVNTNVIGSYNVTYNVTDTNGNNAIEIIRIVNVIDSTTPTISCPVDITVGNDASLCAAIVNYTTPVGADGCSSVTTTQIAGLSSGSSFPVGTTVNTFEVEDASGNIATCSFNITVNDTEAPTISCPSDITVSNDTGMCSAVINYTTPVGNDNCLGQITIQIAGLPSGSSFPIGTTTNTFQVTDAANNITTCSFDVIITDSQAPTISCPSDITVSNDAGLCSAVVSYTTPVGADNCSGQITIQTAGLPSGSIFPVGTTTITFQVTDTANNTATCSFDVTVNDTESPIAICQDISIQLDPVTGSATITPADIDNGSSDNCGVILSLSVNSFTCSDIGNNTVTLTVSDATGNTSTCDATVLVTDLSQNASVSITSDIIIICENQPVTFTASPTNGGTNPAYQWQVNGVDVGGQTSATFISSSLIDGDVVTVLMTSDLSTCAEVVVSNSITITVNDYNAPADAGSNVSNFICTATTINLDGNTITGSGTTGLWTVTSGQTSGFSFSDATSPSSTFTGDIGETYTLTWSIDNPDPCPDSSDSLTVTLIGCNALDFDGTDDNITFRDNYNLDEAFTIEVWIKTEVNNSDKQTIFSKRESNNQIDGYDLRLVNNEISFNWNNGLSLSSSPIQLITDKWHHIAVTYGSSTYKLYIDGIEVNSISGPSPILNVVDCIAGAMDQTLIAPFLPLYYFNGGMDELRIWDITLTETQIRKMMNQEIEDNSGVARGSIVPLDISGLSWNNLVGYYQMNQDSDLSDGNLNSNSNNPISGVLRYMTTLQPETAPLPYQTISDGFWTNATTWLHGSSQYLPNTMGIDGTTPITWNIVRSSHNVSSGNNDIILLGLSVTTNMLSIENLDPLDGQSLRITDYLKINGSNTILKLVGESQLLQDTGSIVDYAGTGKLHRDQQGTANLFNYNYWSSPVSTDGSTFPIGDVLYDGSQPVLWTTAHDANPNTNPITMSSRWLYLYENYPENSYADWNRINENFAVPVGLGFLMKGSGASSPSQNYTFIGKVNNGTISSPITADYEALVGNPYSSAIDSHEFISDNSSSILGTIYYWEHYTTNDTHILRDYQGGFAAYNLTGGNPAVSPPEVSGLGTPSKIPERYIPVSQGFNVFANAAGGTVLFENDQRIFVKESVTGAADNGSVFMRQHNSEQRNPHLPPEPDLVKRLRIDFKTPEDATRPLLLGFVSDDLASDDFNYGYDAINTEAFPNDMSWMITDEKYIIQGVGDFDITKQYPIGIFLTQSGTIEISLNALENFDSEIDVFVYDTLLGTYTRFNDISYQINLDAGDYIDRFFITFMADGILSTIDQELQQIVVNYLTDTNEIYINVPMSINVKQVYLINMLGQTIKSWNMTNTTLSNEMRIPVKHISEGNYIIKVLTTTGTTNKKIIVKY